MPFSLFFTGANDDLLADVFKVCAGFIAFVVSTVVPDFYSFWEVVGNLFVIPTDNYTLSCFFLVVTSNALAFPAKSASFSSYVSPEFRTFFPTKVADAAFCRIKAVPPIPCNWFPIFNGVVVVMMMVVGMLCLC